MADVAYLAIQIDSKGVPVAEERLHRLSKTTGKTAKATDFLKNKFIALAAATASLYALKKVIGLVVQFEKSMAEVASISSDVAGNLEMASTQVRRMAVAMGKDATEMAKGLYQAISAGITDTGEALMVLEASARAAIAGLTDTATAVDVITSAMNAYGSQGKTASEISDVLFTAVREGKTTFAELANSMGRAMAISAQAGVSFEDLTAAIVTLTKGGISTDEAVTSVRATIVSLLKPSDEAAKFAGELGFQFNAAALKAEGLGGILRRVRSATEGNAAAVAKLFPNIRALGGVLALTGEQADEFNRQLNIMGVTAGTTEKAYAIMADTIEHKSNRVIAVLKDFPLALYEAIKEIGSFIAIGDVWNERLLRLEDAGLGLAEMERQVKDRQIEQAKASRDAASAALARAASIREVKNAWERLSKSIDDERAALIAARVPMEAVIKNLKEEYSLLGLVGGALSYETAMLRGATRAQAAEIARLTDLIDKERERMELKRQANAVIQSTLTTEELVLQQMNLLSEAQIAGIITTDEWAKAWTRLQDKLEDTKKMDSSIKQLTENQKMAASGIRSFSDAIVDWASGAEVNFSNVARDFAKMVAKMLLQQSLLRAFGLSAPTAVVPTALGAAFAGGRTLALARGGVVTQPTLFPMQRGAGLMGEAGPEAVMPLTRTSKGELGVKAEGAGANVNVSIINNTGAEVSQSRRQSGDSVDIDVMIGDSTSNHINRGTFDRAMRDSFGVRRRSAAR